MNTAVQPCAGSTTGLAPGVAYAVDGTEDYTMRCRRTLRSLDRWLIRLPLIAVTFVSKIGPPKLAAMGLSFSIPVAYLALVLGALTGRLVIAPTRLMLFLGMGAGLWFLQLVHGNYFSAASLLMLCVLQFPYIFGCRAPGGLFPQAWSIYRMLATALAIFGIAQYLLQFVIGSKWAFPMDNLVPDSMKVVGFNGFAWIEYGSSIFRANGVFMTEPSFFSQLLAIAIVGEMVSRKPGYFHIALFVTGIVVSYSGTGILSLVVCFPLWLIKERRWDWALVIAAVAAIFSLVVFTGVLNDNPFMKVFVMRSSEFTSKGSSGFARFVGGFYMFEEFLWTDPFRALFGLGAGSFFPYTLKATYAAHGMAIFKIVFEYGFIGAILYFGFLLHAFKTSTAPVLLRVAIFVPFLIQNFVPFAHGVAWALLMWSSPARYHFKRSNT